MPPPSWKRCPHCDSPFSASSLPKHEKRCKLRADVKAEHDALQELRKIEGPRPKAIPDWPRCTNCGEQYGPLAINPHMKRCVKLLPHGANGYGPQDHHKDPRFAHIYKAAQVDLKEEAPTLAESVGGALSSLGKSMASLLKALGPQLDDAELSRLRKLFDRFDANTDELLDEDEFGLLLRNCFPTRVADADAVVDEFASADADGSGEVTFEEFVKHYLEMKQAVDPRFDEACAMFEFFDADSSGCLDPDEFLCLLNQIFPEHCDENEERCVEQFKALDADGSGGITFPEFIAHYDALKALYNGWESPAPSEAELEALAAAEEARRLAELEALEAALVECACGLRFLPSVLPEHQRSCVAITPQKKEVTFCEEADPMSSDAPLEGTRASVEFGDNDANVFVACQWCGRTFFPDRLPVHLRVCKLKGQAEITGIRPTITDGRSEIMGRYRSMKSGKWTQSGRIPVGALPQGATKDYSPQKQAVVAEKEAEKARLLAEANAKEAAKEREMQEVIAMREAEAAAAKEAEDQKAGFFVPA